MCVCVCVCVCAQEGLVEIWMMGGAVSGGSGGGGVWGERSAGYLYACQGRRSFK